MPIERPSASLFATAALYDGLPAFLSGPDFGNAGNLVRRTAAGHHLDIPAASELGFPVGGSPPTVIPDFNPIQVFVLGLAGVLNGQGLASANSAGWRFFVQSPQTHTVIMALVTPRPPSGSWKVAAAFYGPGVSNALLASQQLNGLVRGEARYEARMLTVPSINLEAFWLKSLTGGAGDLLVPFPNMSAQLVAGLNTQASYSEVAFRAAIREIAPKWRTSVAHAGG